MLDMLLKSMLPPDFDITTLILQVQNTLSALADTAQQIERIEKKLDFLMEEKNALDRIDSNSPRLELGSDHYTVTNTSTGESTNVRNFGTGNSNPI